jgi:hypothetical protein
MTGRVQTLRSTVAGNRPTGRQPGELYVNWADNQFGVINASSAAQDLLAIPFFSTLSSYAIGAFVVYNGQLYRALAPSSPGAFVPANWAISGGAVSVGDNPPSNPQPGALWWDSIGGQLYVWFVDANSSQWVVANNAASVLASGYLPLSGGTLTGPLTLPGNPTTPLQSVPKQYVDSLPVAMNDNRIINGDMRINQRGVASGTAGGYTVDRWSFSGTQSNKGTWSQQAFNGLGFPLAWNFLSNSAYALLATDNFGLLQLIEADMISDFQWGTTNAQPVTLSFVVWSTIAGTYSGAIRNAAFTRSYPFTFNIPVASVATKINITIPGDTAAGTWVMSGNAASLILGFNLGTGTTYSGPANAWASANYVAATGSVSIVSNNAATFYLTGVKLEIGSVATPYNRQSLAKSLADCQRYFQSFNNVMCTGYGLTGGTVYSPLMFLVTMRATPTVAYTPVASANAGALTTNTVDQNSLRMQITVTTAGPGYVIASPTTLSAEL